MLASAVGLSAKPEYISGSSALFVVDCVVGGVLVPGLTVGCFVGARLSRVSCPVGQRIGVVGVPVPVSVDCPAGADFPAEGPITFCGFVGPAGVVFAAGVAGVEDA